MYIRVGEREREKERDKLLPSRDFLRFGELQCLGLKPMDIGVLGSDCELRFQAQRSKETISRSYSVGAEYSTHPVAWQLVDFYAGWFGLTGRLWRGHADVCKLAAVWCPEISDTDANNSSLRWICYIISEPTSIKLSQSSLWETIGFYRGGKETREI